MSVNVRYGKESHRKMEITKFFTNFFELDHFLTFIVNGK